LKRGPAKKKRKKRKGTSYHPILIGLLKVVGIVVVLGAAGVGFVLLRGYVWRAVFGNERRAALVVAKPPWVTSQLEEKVLAAAWTNGENLKLDEHFNAKPLEENIEYLVPWLKKVKVQQFGDTLHITGPWRKPLVLVESRRQKFYVDAELVVLDYVDIPTLPIVKVRGLSALIDNPTVGEPLQLDDLAAATVIINLLDKMDQKVTPDKPLLHEIAAIDVSNFGGRRNNRKPHIVLCAKNDVQIVWGAEKDAWVQHFEVPDDEKLARLYEYYRQYGSLLGGVKSINLRDPQDRIPQPIERY